MAQKQHKQTNNITAKYARINEGAALDLDALALASGRSKTHIASQAIAEYVKRELIALEVRNG